MRFDRGFSLIELLVVVAVTAVLAGIALPTFQINSTRAKVSQVIPTLEGLLKNVMVNYSATGRVPDSLGLVSGDGEGGYATYGVTNLSTHIHYLNNSTWVNTGAMVQLSIPLKLGQAIPGFSQSTDGTDGSYNSIAIAFVDLDGTIKTYCGQWDDTAQYVPVMYLPTGCNTTNIAALVTGN